MSHSPSISFLVTVQVGASLSQWQSFTASWCHRVPFSTVGVPSVITAQQNALVYALAGSSSPRERRRGV